MTTTEERLARLAQRRTRGDAPSPRRRQVIAPRTRILATGLSTAAVLAGAGVLALADRAASTPPASGPAVPDAAVAAPVTVVVVFREVPGHVAGPVGAVEPMSLPSPAVVAPAPAAAVPVTTSSRS